MRLLTFLLAVTLILSEEIQPTFAQNAENGRRLSERWCSACHAIGSASDKFNRAPSFALIAANETINPDMIASFLLLPHATMPNLPLSRKDAQDIALFIVKMKK
jgi:mono/diheme cytochrome c family protein